MLLSFIRIFVLLAMLRQSQSLRLLLVRHAQSQNNAIAKEVATKYAGRPNAEMRAEFEALRSFEPELSELGSAQADALGVLMQQEFAGLRNQPVPVYCSPMIRTILTARPFLNRLGWQGHIKEDLYEVGGSFQTENGVNIAYPGKNGLHYQTTYPEYAVSQTLLDLKEKGWYTRPGRESRPEAMARADSIVSWLWAQADTHQKQILETGDCVIKNTKPGEDDRVVDLCCVLHGDLLSLIIRRLLAIDDSAHAHFLHLNTAMTYFDLKIRDDGSKSVSLLYLNRVDHLLKSPELISGDEMMRVSA